MQYSCISYNIQSTTKSVFEIEVIANLGKRWKKALAVPHPTRAFDLVLLPLALWFSSGEQDAFAL